MNADMTEYSGPSLDTLRDLFKKGAFDQARGGLEMYLASAPDDAGSAELAEVLMLRRHLDNLDTLKQIHRAILQQDWNQVVDQVEAAVEMGLIWDLELYPLAELLERVKRRRTQAAGRRAQSLLRQAEEAEERQELDQARELYAKAVAIPHLEPSLRAQLQHRLGALQSDARAALGTVPTLMRPDALMEQLVGTILKKSRPQLAEAIRLCAVPFWFDLELLSALRDSDDGLDEKILARMARLSFVQEDDRGRYTFNEGVRRHLLNEWNQNPEGFVEANRRAQSCFLRKLKATSPDDDVVDALAKPGETILLHTLAEVSPRVGELAQNHLYHTLAVDGDAGIALLRQLFHAADEAHRLALAERYLEVAEEQRARLNPGQRAHIDFMHGLLDQLQERWEASRDRFERMLSREGLPATLQARVRRALGNTLIQQEQWVEAIALFEIALQDFQAAEDTLESALTMIGLGRAHLDLALNTQGGGEVFDLSQSWLDKIQSLAMLVGRAPIIVYLMIHLGVRALFPVILRIGHDMDWLIARLFVTASRWFRRADAILRPLDDQEGLGRVEENLAWLYLSLGHFGRAETIYRRFLAREGITVGEYRAARARLGLAQALMHQGHSAQARELLEQIQPVFVAYRHTERIAQTHTALAQTHALEGQPAQAVTHYRQATQLYSQLDDDEGVTEVVEQMQLLRDHPQTDEAVREVIDQTASQVTHRRYLTRFNLPLLHMFRLLALAGLVGVLFLGLSTSIHIESGTDFGVSQALLNSQQSTASPLDPVIELTTTPRLRSSFEVNFVVSLVIVLTAIYLILYTAIGLWLTVRTPLRALQEGQRLDIVVDPDGVGRGAEGQAGSFKIKWEQVAAILWSDRSLLRRPVPFFSRFALFSEQGAVTIDWRTRHYLAARDFIQKHLGQHLRGSQPLHQAIPVYRFGFSVFNSRSGWLFIGTLVLFLAFIITARLAPQVLTTHLGPLPYSMTDLYDIIYLGLLIPIDWWLVVQPLRERIFLKPHTRRVWLIGLIGVLLAVSTFMDVGLGWLKLPFNRPNVALGLFAVSLMGVAVYYVLTSRHWVPIPFRRGDYVYPLPVRLISGVVALILIVLTLGFVGREVVVYHYLALANLNRQRAIEAVENEDHARAQELYEKAFSFYDRALDWGGDDADSYHSQGVMLNLLGRHEEAVESIQKAINVNPRKTAYYRSLSAAYVRWAAARREAGDQQGALEFYELARDSYSLVLEKLNQGSGDLVTTYLLRAGVYSQLGEEYADEATQEDAAGNPGLASRDREAAVEHYDAAYADYAQTLELEPDNAAALSGRGWMRYRLARFEKDREEKRSDLASALADLEQAASIDPEQVSAWTGLGYTHIALGEILAWRDEVQGRVRPACTDSERNPRTPEEKLVYQEENLKAIEAFARATALSPDSAGLHSVQGYLRFNLVNCPDMDDEELYLAAVEDFGRALELEPDNNEWRLRRANLYYVLINDYDRDYYAQAIADYEVLAPLQGDAQLYWILGSLYRVRGELDKAVQNYAKAVELEQDIYSWQWLLGWYAYENGDYQLSVEASQAAASLDPTEPRPVFNWGLALVAKGDAEEAWRVYEDGIAVADALVNRQEVRDRYDEALTDLSVVHQDPASIADALRARLTFKMALTYVELESADEARSTYEEGIAIADGLADQETRRALYDEATADLRAFGADSDQTFAELVTLLESARDR